MKSSACSECLFKSNTDTLYSFCRAVCLLRDKEHCNISACTSPHKISPTPRSVISWMSHGMRSYFKMLQLIGRERRGRSGESIEGQKKENRFFITRMTFTNTIPFG